MKRFILFLMICLLLLPLCACKPDQPYIGTWVLSARSAPHIDDLYRLFGSSLRQFGAAMTLREDGSFSYHLGLTGGSGHYTVHGDTILADYITDNDPHPSSLTLRVVTEHSSVLLLYPYQDNGRTVEIWWEKQDAP